MAYSKSSRQILKQTRSLANAAQAAGFSQFADTLRTACTTLEGELAQQASHHNLEVGMHVVAGQNKTRGRIVGFHIPGKVSIQPDPEYPWQTIRTVKIGSVKLNR